MACADGEFSFAAYVQYVPYAQQFRCSTLPLVPHIHLPPPPLASLFVRSYPLPLQMSDFSSYPSYSSPSPSSEKGRVMDQVRSQIAVASAQELIEVSKAQSVS